jgi:glycosyltransferase involved in cell wall biosynthesis
LNTALCLFTDSREPSGVGVHMLALAAELRDRYDISFVCPPTPAGVPFLERAAAMGLETLPVDLDRGAGTAERFCGWLRARKVQIFHCHAGIGWEGHMGVYAAREAGVPVVVRTEHLPYLITKPNEREEHLRAVQAVDRLICVCKEAAASFRQAGIPGWKISVVLNGTDHRPARPDRMAVRRRLGLPPEACIVLTVGRMTEQKGHLYLAEAAPAVIEREPNTFFAWVGGGPLERELRRKVGRLGLEKKVLFLGGRGDVSELMASSELLALPSLFEGLPLSALEAMAAGLPVVGTRVCGTSEAVTDGVTGRLVEPADPGALAGAILEVLQQPGLAARLGAAGRREVKRKFGAARMARETAAIYGELLPATAEGELRIASYPPMPAYQNS